MQRNLILTSRNKKLYKQVKMKLIDEIFLKMVWNSGSQILNV